MRGIVNNIKTLIVAIVGLIGGFIWAYNTNFDYEPVILISISILEIIGFFLTKIFSSKELDQPTGTKNKTTNRNEQNVEVNVIVGNSQTQNRESANGSNQDRNVIIELKKPKTYILFIDDDTKFKTVKIFKDSGWKNTKTVKDVKSIDLPIVQNSDIIFVDINGVGKLLELEYEGLDLALMIKQKYPEKKVVIYSAKKNTNAFHKAWDIIDARIEKNALPIQFQNVAENYCLSNN